MNRAEVLEQMEPILDTQLRSIDHSPRTRVAVTPDMVTLRPGGGARTLEMTEDGVRSMANFVGIPMQMPANLTPDTFGRVATELLQRKNRYAVVLKDQRITTVIKLGDHRTLNAERVLRTIEASMSGAEFHRVLVLPNHVCSLEVVGDRRQPVQAGDLQQAGANVTFSPIGTVLPTVQSYALRCECTNGQTSNHILRNFEGGGGGGEGDDVWQWFRKSVRDAYRAIDQIVRQYQKMIDEEIPAEDRAAMLAAMLKKARISGQQAEIVRNLAIERPPQTSYDMYNLLTYATSHILEQPKEVRRAQLASAEYLSETTHNRICPLCHKER